MSTSLRTARPTRRRGLLGIATTIAVIGTFLVPLAMNPPAALADTSAQIGSGVECANDMWHAETTADNAGHVYVIYSNYCSNHDFLFYQVSNDGGQTFGAAQTLCAGLGAACRVAARPDLAEVGIIRTTGRTSGLETGTRSGRIRPIDRG